jgi:hypothetical protein
MGRQRPICLLAGNVIMATQPKNWPAGAPGDTLLDDDEVEERMRVARGKQGARRLADSERPEARTRTERWPPVAIVM